MKKLSLFLILMSQSAMATEWYLGIGEIYQADEAGNKMYSLSVEKEIWKFSISHWQEYPKTAWLSEHPEWGIDYINEHTTASISATIYDYSFTENLIFFFDFGLAYTSQVSSANSSHMNFRQNLGFKYKNIQLYLRHTSNANVVPPNRGEDAFVIAYRVSF